MASRSADGRLRHAAGAPASAGGRFTHEPSPAAAASLHDEPMASWTPAEVDTSLAKALAAFQRADTELDSRAGTLERLRRGSARQSDIDHAGKALQEAMDRASQALSAVDEHEREFQRRGGWSRAFLVVSSDGHVHASRSCTTCQPRTQYALLPHYSGADEDRLVADAGAKACTVCFPSAPADALQRPSQLVGDEAREAAERREAERVEDEAARAAKGITTPDGQPLRIRTIATSPIYSTVASPVTAEREAVDALIVSLEVSAPGRDPEFVRVREEHCAETLATIVPALAAKRGSTPAAVLAELQRKAGAKYRRTNGQPVPSHWRTSATVEHAALGAERPHTS